MRPHTIARAIGLLLAVGVPLTSLFAATKERKAVEFFGGQHDPRKVIYIEMANDETLVFDESDNSSYVLYGKALEVRAKNVLIRGHVAIRSFPENSHGDDTPGAGALGDPGGPGEDGQGDGGGGKPGGRGGRGRPGAAGGPGMNARKVNFLVGSIVQADATATLSIDDSGQKGGKGQQGGKGGTGGRGGHGHNRVCGGDGPGNAGPRGAAGASGTGGQGGQGGSGADVVVSCSIFTNGVLKIASEAGKGGDPGDPGPQGAVGEKGEAGAGCGTDGGGTAYDSDTQPAAPEAYIPPDPPSLGDGAAGQKKCVNYKSDSASK